jgi:hypothetical protein
VLHEVLDVARRAGEEVVEAMTSWPSASTARTGASRGSRRPAGDHSRVMVTHPSGRVRCGRSAAARASGPYSRPVTQVDAAPPSLRRPVAGRCARRPDSPRRSRRAGGLTSYAVSALGGAAATALPPHGEGARRRARDLEQERGLLTAAVPSGRSRARSPSHGRLRPGPAGEVPAEPARRAARARRPAARRGEEVGALRRLLIEDDRRLVTRDRHGRGRQDAARDDGRAPGRAVLPGRRRGGPARPAVDPASVLRLLARAVGCATVEGPEAAVPGRAPATRCASARVDNLEHLLQAPPVADLVEHCPRLAVLVTSRRRCGCAGRSSTRCSRSPCQRVAVDARSWRVRGGRGLRRPRAFVAAFEVTADNAAAVERSAVAGRASRWRSSWPPRASASSTAGAARAARRCDGTRRDPICRHGSARCAPPSTGATTC